MAWVRNRGTTRQKRWYINYLDEYGKPIEEPCSQTSKDDALKLARDLEAKCERIRRGVEKRALPDWTIRELAERYFEDVLPTKADPKLREGVIRNHVIAHLGDVVFHRLLPVEVDRWQEVLKKKPRGQIGKWKRQKDASRPISAKTVLNARNMLSALYRYAQKKLKLDVVNPVMDADPIHLDDPEPNPVELDHLGPILANVEPEWLTLFVTAVCIGPRKGELAGLLVGDVDLERRLIHIRRSYDKKTTKTKRSRYSAIPNFLVPALRAQIAGRPPDAILFPEFKAREDGSVAEVMMTADTNLVAILKAAIKKAGIIAQYEYTCRKGKSFGRHGEKSGRAPVEWGCGLKLRKPVDETTVCAKCERKMWAEAIPVHYTFKDLRATFATYALESTGDLDFVQRQIGHEEGSTVTKAHYAKLRAQRMVAHADRLPFRAMLPEGFVVEEEPLPFEVGPGEKAPPIVGSLLPGPRNKAVARDTNLYSSGSLQVTENSEKKHKIPSKDNNLDMTSNPKATGSIPVGRAAATPRSSEGNRNSADAGKAAGRAFGSLLPGAGSKAVPSNAKQRFRVVDGEADPLYTVQQVADHLALNRATVYAMVERGELGASRFASSIRIRRSDLDAFLARTSIPKGGKP